MINDVLVPGLTFGSLYGLVAVGFNILHRPTNVVNFAQGELIMIGAMIMAATAIGRDLPWLLAAAAAAGIVAGVALIEERLAVSSVLRRSAHAAGWVITTLAFSLIVAEVAGKVWTDEVRTVAPPAPLTLRSQDVLGISISSYQIAVIVIAIAIVVALDRVDRTRLGCALRAVAVDRDAARLRGIAPERLSRLSFVIGGALAGFTGVLAAPILLPSVTMGFALLVKGFAALAVGGIGDNRGALLAGWTLGIVEAAGATYVSPGLQTSVLFVVMLAILMVRPLGLLGRGALRHV